MLTGNREFNEVYEKYKNLVLKTAFIYSGDDYDAAEDITQETFLKLYIGFEELKNGNISSWLCVAARNAAINHRKKYRREVLRLDEEGYAVQEELRESTEEEYTGIELEHSRRKLHEKIFAGLMEKNPRWYEAIMLVYYMEIPQAKAAEMMGVRLQVLHSILHRAKKWIAKTYGAEYEEMTDPDR